MFGAMLDPDVPSTCLSEGFEVRVAVRDEGNQSHESHAGSQGDAFPIPVSFLVLFGFREVLGFGVLVCSASP